jgi:Ser/Thr protein kinase RdoA (MazF antagonist)
VEESLTDVFGLGAAREAAAHWGYGDDARYELLCVSENATWLVRDPRAAAPAVLRLNRPGYHDRDALASELAWTAALRRARVVRTPEWLPTAAGEPVACLPPVSGGGPPRHAVLFGYARGEHPELEADASGSTLAEIGELAARLHAHARSWRRPARFRRFSWDLMAALGDGNGTPGRWGDWRAGYEAAERAVLQGAEAQVRQALSGYGCAPDVYGLIHADLRASNLLVAEPATDGASCAVTVIDFDDCGYGWFLYDLAASVSFLEHRPELPALASQWLEGYRRTANFAEGAAVTVGAADIAVLASLVMLRRLQLQAWSSSHADTDMVRSLGPDFAAQTVEVAERYLTGGLLAGVS